MKRYINSVGAAFLFVAIISVGMFSGVSDVRAKEKGGAFAKQIQGSWILVSCINEQNGKKTDEFGPNPRGLMILTPDGHYSGIVMRAALPKFASNDREKGTAGENQAIVQGSIAYFGKYKVVSEKEGKVNISIEGNTFPNLDGQSWDRVMAVKGDELRITNPKPSLGRGINYQIWRRAK